MLLSTTNWWLKMSEMYKLYIGMKSQGIEENHLVYRKARIEEFLEDFDGNAEQYFEALFALFDCKLGLLILRWLKDKDPEELFNRFQEYKI